jgi:beta-methylarginine biosynthesis bifunctional aminotransferase
MALTPPFRPAARRPPRASVLDPASPFTVLVQRLNYAARHPERRFINLADNVPCWPERHAFPAARGAEVYEYAACEGSPALLDALRARERRRWGLDVPPDRILVTNGSLHGVALVAAQLRQPGSVALCQAPILSCVGELFRREQFEVRYFGVEGGRPSWDAVRAELARRPRVVYLNTPNNPTGEILAPDAAAELVALAQAHGATVVIDSVYDDFVFDGSPVAPPLSLGADPSRLYVVNSMSKNYGMPGLRVGWVLSSAPNIAALASAMELGCIAVAGPMQALAAEIVARGNDGLVRHVRAGRELAARRLAEVPGVRFRLPAGGSQLMVELPIDDIEAFGDAALVEFGLILATSGQFESGPRSMIRIPTGASPADLDEGLALLRRALEAHDG